MVRRLYPNVFNMLIEYEIQPNELNDFAMLLVVALRNGLGSMKYGTLEGISDIILDDINEINLGESFRILGGVEESWKLLTSKDNFNDIFGRLLSVMLKREQQSKVSMTEEEKDWIKAYLQRSW
jgi:hypothetical protein